MDGEPAAEPLYGHSVRGRPETEWEPLRDHAIGVGDLAGRFAARFGAEMAARLAGYLHDIGKASPAFQAFMRGRGPGTNHSTAGAVAASALFDALGDSIIARLVAFAIAAHHGHLADGPDLERRLACTDLPDHHRWRELALPLPAAIVPRLAGTSRASDGYRLAFLGRMIFSCLVDADWIETERFYRSAEGKGEATRGGHRSLEALREQLDRYLATFAGRPGPLNRRRADILAHARAKAALPPGLFTMTVPTGGGKTLASLAFALDHAVAHGLDRLVYVIPYTGARIETTRSRPSGCASPVAPHTGARMETLPEGCRRTGQGVAPHAGVRIETCRLWAGRR